MLDAAGLAHVPVVEGASTPLMSAPLLCPEIHGDSGLDSPEGGPVFPQSTRAPVR